MKRSHRRVLRGDAARLHFKGRVIIGRDLMEI
jgi:hypothetical protein